MIQPEELRIGNVIFINDSLRTVEGIVGDQVWFKKEKHLSQDLIINCNPVPLTEGWLLRMGFDKKPWSEYLLNLGDMEVHARKTNNGTWLELMINYENASVSHISYVHQLQNLYYALTGTELKIDK
jgi:hypothetical protein